MSHSEKQDNHVSGSLRWLRQAGFLGVFALVLVLQVRVGYGIEAMKVVRISPTKSGAVVDSVSIRIPDITDNKDISPGPVSPYGINRINSLRRWRVFSRFNYYFADSGPEGGFRAMPFHPVIDVVKFPILWNRQLRILSP